MKTQTATEWGRCLQWLWGTVTILLQVRLIISETEGRFRFAAAGVFPLGFRRQAIGPAFHVTQFFCRTPQRRPS